jgi:hypothetical protein
MHHKRGWLKDDHLKNGVLDGTKEKLHARIWADYTAQQIYIQAQKDILGETWDPLHMYDNRGSDGKFATVKKIDVPKNFLSITYLLYAYDFVETTFKRMKRRNGAELTKQTPVNKGASVFLCPNFAKKFFSARRFYVNAKFNEWNEEGRETGMERTKDEKTAMRLQLRNEWNEAKAKDPNFGTTL